MTRPSLLLVLLAAACGAAPPPASTPAGGPASGPLIAREVKDDPQERQRAIREHYTKYEHRVAMRDGVRLHTAVYVPKDRSRTWPILMKRTPYGLEPYGVDRVASNIGPSLGAVREGYIFVLQDVRGRWMSEGTFVDMRPQGGKIDESTDAYDTIDWLVKNVPANNGKVGVWGISYPGFYASTAAISGHPALKAASPQAPIADWFEGDDDHHNGAFFLAQTFNFFGAWGFGRTRPEPTKRPAQTLETESADAYDFFLRMGPLGNLESKLLKGDIAFWKELMAHGTYDAFWRARNLRPHLKSIKAATLVVGGWFDSEDLFGALATYRAIEAQSRAAENTLVMGPWSHGGWSHGDGESLGHVRFGAKTSVFFRERIELPFFEHHLKGKGAWKPPEAWVFATGVDEWRAFDAWPPRASKEARLYLRAGGKLDFAPPPAADGDGRDEYVSDPAKPVPYRAGHAMHVPYEFMVDDQRFAARRPDVLTYTSEALTDDVVLCGPVEASLHVATTGTDADFVVKLIDVYPDDFPDPEPNPTGVHLGGFQQLVRAEVMRGKFRNKLEAPEPFKPGEPTLVRFAVPDVCHAFRPGHRVMVQVQSSWFPLVDRNPQTFVDIYAAKEADFRAATHTLFRSAARPSSLAVRVLPKL